MSSLGVEQERVLKMSLTLRWLVSGLAVVGVLLMAMFVLGHLEPASPEMIADWHKPLPWGGDRDGVHGYVCQHFKTAKHCEDVKPEEGK